MWTILEVDLCVTILNVWYERKQLRFKYFVINVSQDVQTLFSVKQYHTGDMARKGDKYFDRLVTNCYYVVKSSPLELKYSNDDYFV